MERLKPGFLPVDIFFYDSVLPALTVVQGDTGLRGYAARFFGADGRMVEKGEGLTARLYAVNPEKPSEAFYMEGVYQEGVWLLEVPVEAISKAGRVILQAVLFEGTSEMIQTRASTVEVGLSIAQGGTAGHSVRVDFDKVDQMLEEAKKVLADTTAKAQEAKDYADRGNQDLATLEAGEAGRVEAERKRASDYEAFSSEGKRTVESLKAQDSHYRQEIGAIESQEAERVQAEETRKSQEASRVSAESARATQEEARSSEEAKRAQAESARDKAESLRASQEAERERAESARESSEGSRSRQEAERQESERIRENQEAGRVEAEKARKSTFEGWDKTMQGILPDGTSDRAGVVKVSGISGETAPYTVPSMGALADGLAKAGKVKSVNGQTGDVVIREYDDSGIKSRVTALEQREDKDTTYPLATTSQDGLLSAADKGKLDGLSGALGAKADKGHSHDDRYYTENEVDDKLADKAGTGHTHDDRYYTEAEVDSKLSSHTHSEYQTQAQVKAQIDQKFVLCTSLDDAKSKQSSGSYPVGTIFLIKKEG